MSSNTSGRGSRVAAAQQQAQLQAQAEKIRAEAELMANARTSGRTERPDDRVWVCCNKCDKWRALPSSVDSKSLPDIWVCTDNIYDPKHASCDAPEEAFRQEDRELKQFFKVWSKRLKNSDKAEQRLPPSAITRGRKRRLDIEWIQCTKPSCGKWRAISLRGLDTSMMLRKLNRNPRGGWHTNE
jgi:hypothetical protein